MGLVIKNVFDKRTGKCTQLTLEKGVWKLPDGTPTSLPGEPDSLVREDDFHVSFGFMLIVTAAVYIYWLIKT